MKLAALASSRSRDKRPKASRNTSDFDSSRNWQTTYEGLPNTEIIDVQVANDGCSATVTLRSKGEPPFYRQVGGLAYVVGRRGSLDYLSPDLLEEVLPKDSSLTDANGRIMISGQTLREEANEDLELAPHVFVIGSLTGDSLIRFAYGGCAYAAGKIVQSSAHSMNGTDNSKKEKSNGVIKACLSQYQTPTSSPKIPAMNGLDGHEASPVSLVPKGDMPLDRRKAS